MNPSQGVAEVLAGTALGGARVESVLLPVDANRAPEVLREALRRVRPDGVLLTGLASGRPQLSLERVAVNVADFRIPDNAGVIRTGEPVVEGGPDAYLTSLPVHGILATWREARVPGYVSDTAGLYLCNQVMYVARHALPHEVACGFLHVPANEEVALAAGGPVPYLPQAEIVRGVRVALDVIARHASLRSVAASD